MHFAGKTVVITGASMGIGEAIAASFASEGANLVLAARSAALLEKVAGRIAPGAGRIITVPCDVTLPADIDRLVRESEAITGRVDLLINNAGVGMNGAVETLDLTAWRRCLEVNLLGAVGVIQAFLPGMKAARGGSIVQISSVLGKVSAPYTAGYNASKYALNAISDALRLEVAPYGIQVISIYPGSTESSFRTNSLGEFNPPKVRPFRVTADKVARRVVKAVRRGERDVYISLQDTLLCWFGTRFPRLTDFALRRMYRQKT